jgi:hypothetical protein
MSTYRFCFRGPRTDELEDFVAGGATFLAAGANLEFDVVLSDDTRADDLKEVLERHHPASPPRTRSHSSTSRPTTSSRASTRSSGTWSS